MHADVEVKISTFCRAQGDAVHECIHIGGNLDHEEAMFRVMLNTAFIKSNVLGQLNWIVIIFGAAWNVNNNEFNDFQAYSTYKGR